MNYKNFIKTIAMCIITAAISVAAYAQTSVFGTVTDTDGHPVVGVTVMVVGAMNATQTNFEGEWTLQVEKPEKAVIQFSCLGYRDVSETIGTRAIVNVVMSESNEALDEIVVVGYGTQKKVNLTGSVTSLDFSEISENRTIITTSAALAGLSPGMMVRQTDGQPGSESTTIRIRGTGTFTRTASGPLVLVDGIEWDMDNLNPSDIESISVLKDASSTAIYGSRAANGVILVTTKSGEASKPRISYSYNAVFQKAYNNLGLVSDYAEYMELVNESCDNSNEAHGFSQTVIDLWREKKQDPYGVNEYGVYNFAAYPNTDWFDEVFVTGFTQKHEVSISGGSKNIRYLISASYLDNSGIMPRIGEIDASSQKMTFRANLEADVTKWFTVGAKIYGQFQSLGKADVESTFDNIYEATPGMYPGTLYKWGIPANVEDSATSSNPLYYGYDTAGTDHRTRINGTVYAKIRPYKGISIEGSVNYSPYYRFNHSYSVQKVRWNYSTNSVYETSNLEDAQVSDGTYRNYYVNTEILARYDTTIKNDHELGVLLGYTTTDYLAWSYSTSKKGATDWSLNDGSTYSDLLSASYSAKSGWALRSYFARVNYIYKNRYLFEANVRADGSSVFGLNTRYGVFPSFSAGWKIHEEPWMKKASNWLSQLKLRASWGETGNNQGIGNYDWQATYTAGRVVVDGSNSTSLYISSMSNVDLKWETTSSLDIGIDAGFFDNRLTAEIDYYYKSTRDILYTPTTYSTMGDFSGVPANLGNLWNQGFEIALNWKDTVGKNFYYYVGVNFSFNKNMVTKFKGKLVTYWQDGIYNTNYSDVAENWSSPGVLLEGHSIGEHYIYKLYNGTGEGYSGGVVDSNAGPKDGMIRTEADMAWVRAMIASGYTFDGGSTIAKDQLWYGDFIYADLNGDGDYGNSYDRYFSGHSAVPSYNMGVTFGLAWKGLEFSMIWSGAFDYYLNWNTTYYNVPRVQKGYGILTHIANDHYFYDPENPSDSRTNIYGKYPRLATTSFNNKDCDFYEYKADYFKLKNVTLAYSLPEKWMRKVFINQLKFYVSGENLLTITSYPGMDPEIGTSIGYPLMRQYTIGVQITF